MKIAASLFTLLFAQPHAITTTTVGVVAATMEYMNEIKILEGHTKKHHVVSPLPHT